MEQAPFQRFINRFIWNVSKEERGSTVNLEDPNVPLDGFTLREVLGGGRATSSGVTVTPDSSLKLSAVWRCVSILSGVFASLPSKPYDNLESGRVEAKQHSTYKLFTRRPSPSYTKSVYWERAMIHLLLKGNHYAEIIFKGSQIVRFDLINPNNIQQISYGKNGTLYYFIKGRETPVPAERMIHIPHLGDDPIMGKGTITYAREDIGIETARRDWGGKFWADGGRAEGLLIPQQKLTDPQRAQLKGTFRDAKREGGTVVAPFGVQYEKLSIDAADSEFIQSGNFSIAAICRWFGVPLDKLSELSRATHSNIEHQAIAFLQDTMSPLIQKFEDEYTTKCYTLPDEENMYLEFNMAAYQRADSVSQSEFYASAIQNGYMKPSEVREKLNLSKEKGSERLFIQQNMMPLDSVDKILSQKKSTPAPVRAKDLLAGINTNGNGNH